ncbi:MAG TPA: GTPase Era [Burkholderiales bacterium]|nr:GTPase Era [Burkholderiales bacterium]
MSEFRCGHIAIVGRPNVGKSTLLNRLVGQKLSITSRKPQTTRHKLCGIVTRKDAQFIFVDTPGFQTQHGGNLNKMLNRNVRQALQDTDAIVVVVEAGVLEEADRAVLKLLPKDRPVVLAVNKADKLKGPTEMLPYLNMIAKEFAFTAVVPLSARLGKNTTELLNVLRTQLPEQPAIYDEDEITDRNERFLAAELIREKLFRSLGEEVPYGSAVVIDRFQEEGKLRRIYASIVVDREGHKAIIIGKKGEKLKTLATAARLDMEKLFGGKVFLEIWVKVRSGWSEDASQLRKLGYDGG